MTPAYLTSRPRPTFKGCGSGTVRFTLRAAQCRDDNSSVPLPEASLSAGHHQSRGAGFPLEPRQAVRISGKRLGQDLQRHLAVQLGIGSLIDLAHAPLADEGGDIVVCEPGADV